jgi:hypothetical protein
MYQQTLSTSSPAGSLNPVRHVSEPERLGRGAVKRCEARADHDAGRERGLGAFRRLKMYGVEKYQDLGY